MLMEEGELEDTELVIPEAVMSELEHQASQGHESGVTGIDEVGKLQDLATQRGARVLFAGERPHPRDLERENLTELRQLAREVAEEMSAQLVTSDRVQAHVSRARGLNVWYLHAYAEDEEPDIEDLELVQYFEDDVMSVHMKAGSPVVRKTGTPGQRRLIRGETLLDHAHLSAMAREIIEAARRNPDSFVEIERPGAVVCQLGPIRVAIGRPPFADAIEITATRPVARLSLEDYDLPMEVIERLTHSSRGVFISGPPGSGKSTFAQAAADYLHAQDTVVKTMESPRDLQVDPEITQYAPLDGSMELTSDVLLLVRPDYVIYDEVRKTDDFSTFADMRLAGVGLLGVTHANRAIDAIQRLLNRVELGMIPQVVDTVVHIHEGQIQQILELKLTVKVPEGMQQEDLARPVVVVRDHETDRAWYEIYTYGEQTVVMPLDEVAAHGQPERRDQLAEEQLAYKLNRRIDGDFEVRMKGANEAVIFVDADEIARVIGSGGSNVKRLEQDLGVRLDIRTFDEAGREYSNQRSPSDFESPDDYRGLSPKDRFAGEERGRGDQRRWREIQPQLRQTQKHLVLVLDPEAGGDKAEVCINGETLIEATVGRKGEIRVRRKSPEGRAIVNALDHGDSVTVRV